METNMAMQNRNVQSKVAEGYELEALTKQGWRLAEVLQETFVESFSESVPFVIPGQSYATSGSGTKGFLVTKNKFLMHRDGSLAIAEAEARVDEAERRGRELSDQLVAADKKTAEWKQEANNLLSGHQTITRENGELKKQVTQLHQSNLKMERDIAKIRQAVGELKMKEILEQ